MEGMVGLCKIMRDAVTPYLELLFCSLRVFLAILKSFYPLYDGGCAFFPQGAVLTPSKGGDKPPKHRSV